MCRMDSRIEKLAGMSISPNRPSRSTYSNNPQPDPSEADQAARRAYTAKAIKEDQKRKPRKKKGDSPFGGPEDPLGSDPRSIASPTAHSKETPVRGL